VDAVTAGTARAIPAGNGTSSVVLSGADGATYTYRNVLTSLPVAPARTAAVTAGTPIGTSGPGGLTFSISVPDVHGLVDADEAMQGWASGLSPDVRALPSGIASSVSAPTRDQVLLLTSSGAPGAGASGAGASGTGAPGTAASGASTSAITAALAKSLAGPLVQVRDATLDGSTTSGSTTPDGTTLGEAALAGAVDRQIAASGSPALTIITLPDGTPAEAASLASALPASRQLLWIAPPGTTAKQAAAYRAIVAGHPGFRVESLPAALGQGKTGSAQARDLATATLISSYASAAYRLRSFSSQPDAVLSWAEAQLGKPASGLTTDAFAQAGIALPQGAAAQWQQTNGRPVADNKLTPGDLVFFAGPESAPGQVGIYAGNGEVIDSSSSRTASSRTASSGTTSSGTVRFQPLTAVSDYTGSTDPYTPVPESALASGLGSWLTAPVAALAVPGALSEYQSFARQLSDSTWGPSQFPYLYELWERESGWNPAALNPVSGAFGIPQSLPAGKMAAAGPDWASDAYTQIIWGIDYISATYGDPQAAWSHEVANNWY
jgi:cell wall-associated NlpC family hydrolase